MRWCALLVGLVAFLGSSWAHAEDESRQVIQKFSDQLLAVMKQGKALGFQGREEKLRPAVAEAYDMQAMTRSCLGMEAGKLTPDQLNQLAEAFTDYTVANYAEEFDDWGGESIVVDAPRLAVGGAVVVPSRIAPKTGSPTEIDYEMHQTGGGQWRVIDVLLEGTVSQVAVRRSEFVSIFRREGFPGLIKILAQKTAALAPQ